MSDSCIFDEEYVFIILKKETGSSNKPNDLPSVLVKMSQNLSHVQWGINTVFASWPSANAFDCTLSIMSFRNW